MTLVHIPCMSLTLAQQGGIGYPPVIVKLDRWYAVSDSRMRKPPRELEPLLWWQRLWRSPYDHRRDPYFHSQIWVYRKYESAPCLTWQEVMDRVMQGTKVRAEAKESIACHVVSFNKP